jgi:hypothetical protein
MIECSLDFNLDDTQRSVVASLNRARDVLAAGDRAQWTLDCRSSQYLGPDAVALIASCVLEGRRRSQELRVLLPDHPKALRGFLHFSGLRNLLEGGAPPDPDHPENETVPLAVFERAAWNLCNPIVRLIHRHIELSDEAEDYLRLGMVEVIQNIEDHAESPIGGAPSARFFRNHGEARIAIVDRGLGIAQKIRRSHPEIRSDVEALLQVLAGGLSSKSRPRNKGLGVSNLAASVKACGGRLLLLAGNALAEVDARNAQPRATALRNGFRRTAAFTLRVGPRG